MNNRNISGRILLSVFFLAAVLLSGASVGSAIAKDIMVTCQMPVDHFDSKAVELFIKKAEEKSHGKLKFKYFPAGQLYNDVDLVDVLPKGGVQLAQIGLDRHVGRVSVGHFCYPYFAGPDAYFRWWYDKACGAGIFYKILRPQFAKDNIHLISSLNYATTYAIITNKPVHTLEDYQGMRIRSSGKSLGAFLESLGAKATVLTSADVYLALQRGTIDGALSGTSSFVSRKWYEVAKYVQIVPLGNIPFGFAANMTFWKSLKPEEQEAINEAAREMEIWAVEKSMEEHDQCVAVMKKAGVEIFTFPPDVEEKVIDKGLDAVGTIVKPDVGDAVWSDAISQLKKAIKADKPAWKEMLQKREF